MWRAWFWANGTAAITRQIQQSPFYVGWSTVEHRADVAAYIYIYNTERNKQHDLANELFVDVYRIRSMFVCLGGSPNIVEQKLAYDKVRPTLRNQVVIRMLGCFWISLFSIWTICSISVGWFSIVNGRTHYVWFDGCWCMSSCDRLCMRLCVRVWMRSALGDGPLLAHVCDIANDAASSTLTTCQTTTTTTAVTKTTTTTTTIRLSYGAHPGGPKGLLLVFFQKHQIVGHHIAYMQVDYPIH